MVNGALVHESPLPQLIVQRPPFQPAWALLHPSPSHSLALCKGQQNINTFPAIRHVISADLRRRRRTAITGPLSVRMTLHFILEWKTCHSASQWLSWHIATNLTIRVKPCRSSAQASFCWLLTLNRHLPCEWEWRVMILSNNQVIWWWGKITDGWCK